jgi:hypothetical protein
MSTFSLSHAIRFRFGTIGAAALLFAPHLVQAATVQRPTPPHAAQSSQVEPSNDPNGSGTVIGTEGLIERTSSTMPATCAPNDEHLEQGREQLEAARTAREATRERVIEDHLRLTQEPTATIETAQDQEDLEGARSEVRDAKQDVRRDEAQLATTHCASATLEEPRGPVNPDFVDVRVELPAKYLQPLQHALGSGTGAITAYRRSDRTAITGRLISVESALAGDKPIVIARARLDDSLHQLRDAEPVDVAVQLPAA